MLRFLQLCRSHVPRLPIKSPKTFLKRGLLLKRLRLGVTTFPSKRPPLLRVTGRRGAVVRAGPVTIHHLTLSSSSVASADPRLHFVLTAWKILSSTAFYFRHPVELTLRQASCRDTRQAYSPTVKPKTPSNPFKGIIIHSSHGTIWTFVTTPAPLRQYTRHHPRRRRHR